MPALAYQLDAPALDEVAADEKPRHPKDPRRHPSYRPRGPKTFRYTLADLAGAAGVTLAAVRKAIEREQLDPGDLRSVVAWLGRSHRPRPR